MKKITVFTFLLPVLALGATFSLTNKSSPSVKEVAAAATPQHLTGFFEKVKQVSDLEDGDQVVLTQFHEVLYGFGGEHNGPLYRSDDTYFTNGNDYRFLGIDDGDYPLFTINIHNDNEYTFRGNMEVGSKGPFDVLLGYCVGSTDFDNINEFEYPYFGAYKYTNSKFNDSCTHFTLKDNMYEYYNITITNVLNKDCAKRFNIFRLVEYKAFYGANEPNLRNYYINNDIDLHGFYVDIDDEITYEMYRLSYEDNPQFFYMTDYKAKAGITSYNCYIHGLNQAFPFTILEPTTCPNYWFEPLPSSEDKDYRGSYLAVEQEEGSRYYNGRYPSVSNNSTEVTITNNKIAATNTSMLEQVIILDKVEIEGLDGLHYVAKNKAPGFESVYYVNTHYDDYIYDEDDNSMFISTSSTVEEKDIVYIIENPNGGMQLAFKNKYGQYYGFSYKSSSKSFFFETYDSYQNARLYKLEKTEEQHLEDYVSFISTFNDEITCDASGQSRYVFETQWNRVKEEYDVLSIDAKGYLANLTYTPQEEVSGSLKDIVNKYDLLISKYTDLDDFMDRKSVSGWTPLVPPQTSVFSVLNNSTNVPLLVIVLVSGISLTSFIIVMMSRRRKNK